MRSEFDVPIPKDHRFIDTRLRTIKRRDVNLKIVFRMRKRYGFFFRFFVFSPPDPLFTARVVNRAYRVFLRQNANTRAPLVVVIMGLF